MSESIAKLIKLDIELFEYLNGLHTEGLDMPMYLISQGWAWFWVYLIVVVFLVKNYNWKFMLMAVAGIGLTVFFADRGSVELFKEVFQRPRPSHNPLLEEHIHLVKNFKGEFYKGGKYGFVSSHASNYFGIGTYLALVMSRFNKQWWFWMMMWAALISYSRIYLGVHYPGDVLGGAIFGMACGSAAFLVFRFFENKYPQLKE